MVSRKIKNLLIIGGSNGIGKESVSFFKKKKFKILVLDIEKKKKIKDISYLNFDISKTQNHKKILQTINKQINKIDYVINFVKAGERKNIKTESLENWNLTMNVNLVGSFFFIRDLINENIKKKLNCNIINISSIASKFTTRESPSYHISKAGINVMTKLFANEYGKKGIIINSVSPAFILQKRYQNLFYKKTNFKFKNIINFVNKTSKIGSTNDLFELCSFLLSEKNKFINGQDIMLDGGSNSVNPDPVALLLNYEKL